MSRKIKYHFLLATALSFIFLNTVEFKQLTPQQSQWLTLDSEAQAKKSGGRSGGGSFKKRSSPSRSKRSSSSSRSTRSSRSYSSHSTGGGGGDFLSLLFTLGIVGVVIYAIAASQNNKGSQAVAATKRWEGDLFDPSADDFDNNKSSQAIAATDRERDNDIVTITQLQIALLAPAEDLQTELSELSRNADTDSDKGLVKLLQESALTLMRHEDYWTHVLSNSETCNIVEAETKFDKLQFQERSKFSDETLVNVNGERKIRSKVNPDSEDSGLYIVVTLLLGSADDNPLFETTYSRDELKAALSSMVALRAGYFMTFYLLWTPQQKPEALTYDELLMEYPEMMQL